MSTSYAEAGRKCLQVMPKPGKAMGEPYNITDGDFVVGHITECS